MKLNELKTIIKESVKVAVKEAIQEEMKDILLEAVKGGTSSSPKTISTPQVEPTVNKKSREELRESYKNILGETAASFNTSNIGQPLQVTSTDTTSPNGQLPQGEVGMDQIMNLMNGKV